MDNQWATETIGVLSALGVLGIVWRYVVRPLARAAATVNTMGPVLRQVATDFAADGGRTLKEQIDENTRQLVTQGETLAAHTIQLREIRDLVITNGKEHHA